MAVVDVKNNTRLKIELDGGFEGNRHVLKSKTFSRIKTDANNEDLFQAAHSLASLQSLPLYKVKKLEEIELVEEV
ncbi:MAG: DUF1659 domain-containing protein [Tissierellia bacterium]|nr:DUF1659 domain-containing protein [Tissierellia bacterium]